MLINLHLLMFLLKYNNNNKNGKNMSIQLKAVNNFCEIGFKTGKIIPLTFEFPSFKIVESMFKETAKEIVNDKVASALLSGKYGHHLMPNLTIDDLIQAQVAKSEHYSTNEQNGKVVFAEKILPIQMKQDENLDYNEINRKTLIELCVSRLKYAFTGIEANMQAYSNAYSRNIMTKNKFVATMLMMKEMIPTAYKQFNLSLKNHPNQSLFNDLKSMEEVPDISIVAHIMEVDNKFAEKHFPREYKFIVEQNNSVNELKLKSLKFS